MSETYTHEDDGTLDGVLHGYCDRKFRDILRQGQEHGAFVGDALGCPHCFVAEIEAEEAAR